MAPFSWHSITRFQIIAFAMIVLALGGVRLQAQTNADWEWVYKHFPETLDRLLPLKKDPRTFVAYRSYQDLYTDVLEYSFVIGQDRSSGLFADIRVADKLSIFDQIMEMHRRTPGESAQSIEARLKVKTIRVNERNCPAIGVQFGKLKKLQLTMPEFDLIVLHPLMHEFQISAGAGDLKLSLVDGSQPLVKWALETRQALELCSASAP